MAALRSARSAHGSSLVDGATWLVTGGLDDDFQVTDTSEVWQEDQEDGDGFAPAAVLPLPLYDHCQLSLDSSYVMVVGGSNDTSVSGPGLEETSTSVHMLDWRAAEWLPQLPDAPQGVYADACGVIDNSQNGLEVVVMHTSEVGASLATLGA